MAVLSFRDTHVRRTVAQDPRLKHARILSSGQFSRIFTSPRANRVFKLTVDQSYVAYLPDRRSPKGAHKPLLYRDYGIIGETRSGVALFLLEIEQLRKIRRGSANAQLVCNIVRHFEKRRGRRRPHLPHRARQVVGLTAKLATFLRKLERFSERQHYALDVHEDNIMQREDGTLVINDPLSEGYFFHFGGD